MTAKDIESKPDSPRQQAMDASEHVDPASAQIYLTDEFRMYGFKVLQCSKRYRHDWATCPFAHPSENGKRRDPRTHTGIACSAMKSSSKCPRGDSCKFAHNAFEYWLHPSRYRTHLCTDGANCKRKICFFAHSIVELREATQDCGILTQQTRIPPTTVMPQGLGTTGAVYRPQGDMLDMAAVLCSKVGGPASTLIGSSDAALLASLGLPAPPPPPPPSATLLQKQHAQLPKQLLSTTDELASLLAALQVLPTYSQQDGIAAAPLSNMMSNAVNAQLLAGLLQVTQANSVEALLQQLTANYVAGQLASPDRSASMPFVPPALGGPPLAQYGAAPGTLPWADSQYSMANDASLLNNMVGGTNAMTSAPRPQWLTPNTAQVSRALGGNAQGAADLQYLVQLGNNSSRGLQHSSTGQLRYSLDLPRGTSNTPGGAAGSSLAAFTSGLPAGWTLSPMAQDQWQQLEGLRSAQSFSGVRLMH